MNDSIIFVLYEVTITKRISPLRNAQNSNLTSSDIIEERITLVESPNTKSTRREILSVIKMRENYYYLVCGTSIHLLSLQ